MAKLANLIGMILYCVWGLLHIAGGISIMSATNETEKIAIQASARPISEISSFTSEAVIGILNYHAFNLIWIGVFAIFVSVMLIRRNLQLGYWLNFLVLGSVEIGLVAFMLLPGNMYWSDGSIGLGLFFAALFLTTVGTFGQSRMTTFNGRNSTVRSV